MCLMLLCCRCKLSKEPAKFYADRRSKTGKNSACKECVLESQKLNYIQRGDDWRSAKLVRDRANRRKTMDTRRSQGRCDYCDTPRLPNLNQFCLRYWLESRAVKNCGTKAHAATLESIAIAQNFQCPYTGDVLIPGLNMWLDHKLPVSRFPDKKHDPSNWQWVDKSVNIMKGNLTHDEFVARSLAIASRLAHSRDRAA